MKQTSFGLGQSSTGRYPLAASALLWPAAAFAYPVGGAIILIPLIALAAFLLFLFACWVLIPALMKAWAMPASGSVRVGVALAAAMIGMSAMVVVGIGAVSIAAPFRASPLIWRSLTLATAIAAVVIISRKALGTPNAALPRFQKAMAVSWALLLPLGGLWDGWTSHYQPVQRTALDAPLLLLRTLRAEEAGVGLSSAMPPADTCVLRVRPPGAAPDQAFAIAIHGRGTATALRADPAADVGLSHSAMLVGLPGKTPGVATYWGLSRVSFRVWQWQSPELRPPEYWRAGMARDAARERRQSIRVPGAASDVQSRSPETFSEEMLRINREHQVSDSDRPEPHRLNVVTDEEIRCDASVPHCRRFRAHLVADGAPVELEERCSNDSVPSSFSAFGRGYRAWH